MKTPNPYIPFGDVARNQLGMQCQYASRYVRDAVDEGFRFDRIDTGNYHDILIHEDDVTLFVERVRRIRRALGAIE